MKNYFEQYKTLRNEIDSFSKNLELIHAGHIKCKAGCDLCCMDYSVFPIEFHNILTELKKKATPPAVNKNAQDTECVFLNNHQCAIYKERPVICRTHGLPLLYMAESGDWELSACELNFTEFDMGNFTEENTFPQDTFNSKLFVLNRNFIQEFKEKKYQEFDLIPIKNLKKYL